MTNVEVKLNCKVFVGQQFLYIFAVGDWLTVMRFFFNLFDFMCCRCNGMKNFACQKAFQDLEMDALMSLWSDENYCEILVHDLCRCNGMKNFASQKAFQDLEKWMFWCLYGVGKIIVKSWIMICIDVMAWWMLQAKKHSEIWKWMLWCLFGVGKIMVKSWFMICGFSYFTMESVDWI